MDVKKIMKDYWEDLESKGYNVVYMGLYGSQNYNLHDDNSDVDVKAIVIPTLKDLILRKEFNKVYKYDTGEVVVKDIVSYNAIAAKGNPAFLEPVVTEYWIGDVEVRNLLSQHEINYRSALGMMYQKREAIVKGLPKSNEHVQKGLYDPKQLHHVERLSDIFLIMEHKKVFLQYSESAKESMMKIKREPTLSLEDALERSSSLLATAESMLEELDYKYESKDLTEQVAAYVEEETRKQLLKQG